MSALTLTGAIPGLLRRGSPVRNSGHLGGRHVGYVVPCGDGYFYTCPLEEPSQFRRGPLMHAECCHVSAKGLHEIALDLTDPTGRYHALLWLRKRGHDLSWAEDEAEVLAWSVLSVARGGNAIRAIDDVPRLVNTRCSLAQFAGASFWWTATAEDRDFYAGPDGKHHGWYFVGMHGPETGDDAIRIVCGHALADRVALRNPGGSLTLPELPRVTP